MRTLNPFIKSLMQIALFWVVASALLWISPSRVVLFPVSLAAVFLIIAASVCHKDTLFDFVVKRMHWFRYGLFLLLLGAFVVRGLSEIWTLIVLAALLVLVEVLANKLYESMLRQGKGSGQSHEDPHQ